MLDILDVLYNYIQENRIAYYLNGDPEYCLAGRRMDEAEEWLEACRRRPGRGWSVWRRPAPSGTSGMSGRCSAAGWAWGWSWPGQAGSPDRDHLLAPVIFTSTNWPIRPSPPVRRTSRLPGVRAVRPLSSFPSTRQRTVFPM